MNSQVHTEAMSATQKAMLADTLHTWQAIPALITADKENDNE